MLGKKLLTLTCAAGILACGACFGPIYRPPPPPSLDLQGVQSVRVEVTNDSESHHLDPSDLARRVAYNINWQTRNTGVSAHIQMEDGPGDAVLRISVLNESVSPSRPPASHKKLSILIRISARLTRKDGQVIWGEAAPYSIHYNFPHEDPSDVWNDVSLLNFVTYELSSGLVHRMFYGH
jgi:hypothetical protein